MGNVLFLPVTFKQVKGIERYRENISFLLNKSQNDLSTLVCSNILVFHRMKFNAVVFLYFKHFDRAEFHVVAKIYLLSNYQVVQCDSTKLRSAI